MLWQSRIGIRKVLIAMLHQKIQEDVEKMLKQITNIIIKQEGDFNKISQLYNKHNIDIKNIPMNTGVKLFRSSTASIHVR